MKSRLFILTSIIAFLVILTLSCSSTKYVPDGEYLLVSATVKSDQKVIPTMEIESYIKQKPNYKTFAIFKLPLFIYNLSGRDTTKWINRTLRHAGDAPILYDSTKLDNTVRDLKRMMTNKGYLNAEVSPIVKLEKKKANVIYDIHVGDPYIINTYDIEVSDTLLSNPIMPLMSRRSFRNKNKKDYYLSYNMDSLLRRNTLVQKDSKFDLDMLDMERDRLTSMFRRSGYYAFNKEYIGFEADTTLENNKVDVDLTIYPFAQRAAGGQVTELAHRQYRVKDVEFRVDYNPLTDNEDDSPSSVVKKDNYTIKYGKRGEYIKPNVILDNCYIRPGALFDENMTTQTYSALSQLRILKNVNITYKEIFENDSTQLHCIITCVPDKKQGVSAEIDGTNSDGYFGVGAGVGYSHRNAFKGSELFNIKLRGAYEAITSSFANFNENYFEIGGETALTFPRFMFPFLKTDFKKQIHASTQFNASYTFQRRPSFFTRTVLSSGVKYIWQDRRQSLDRHVFDFIDLSYVHLPKASLDAAFFNKLTPATQYYSFKDHFILGAGYTFSRSNIASSTRKNQPIYSLRASIESAGNLLSLAAALAKSETDSLGSKQVFGTNFAQYVRGNFDYSKTYKVDEKNSIAWHIGAGVAYPYGNNKQIPIQKRFFSGGANSVRGWAIRTLGPGSYYREIGNNKDDFYFHSGDIRLDANVEYRSKLFWVLELGAFLDAGNIWTIREYDEQLNGSFKLNKFYKEIAVAWGLGVRLDFEFVLLRLDCGWKAYDPSGNPDTVKWPILEPHKIKKNTAFHIAIGYPF